MNVNQLSSLSLVDLKQLAKTKRIKQYYIMKRQQLIQLLSLEELPAELKIEKMTIHELRQEAKNRNMRGFWNLRRERLVELLYNSNGGQTNDAAPNQDDKNQGEANKHNKPKEEEPKNVWIKDSKHSVEEWAKDV